MMDLQKQYDSKIITTYNGKNAIDINPESNFYGWIYYKGGEGQWVSLRRALPQEVQDALRRLRDIQRELDIPDRG